MIKFEKVSFEQFEKDFRNMFQEEANFSPEDVFNIYNDIKLPERGTMRSAGYDFYSPCNFKLATNTSLVIPTGIRWVNDQYDLVLCMYPRSGQGFKTGCSLANTVGIIDSDYFESDNEGHIMIKLTNNNKAINKDLEVTQGQAFCQGIMFNFARTDDDKVTNIRNGGMGSTG